MTDSMAESFVAKFAAAWAERDGAAFLALWHPDGELHSPFYDRTVYGREFGGLTELQRTQLPHLGWRLLDWTRRGEVVVIEWEAENRYGEQIVRWRGVDKLALRDGRIAQEVVYVDTAPLQAMRAGTSVAALVPLPPALD